MNNARIDFVNKLIRIGKQIKEADSPPYRVAEAFVEGCHEAFGLTEEEYYVLRKCIIGEGGQA